MREPQQVCLQLDEVDPLVGPHDGTDRFTIPQLPIRRRLTALNRFVVNCGGQYCFMPGLRTLRWIAELETRSPTMYIGRDQ
jgi:hypothetical protein